MVHQQHPARWRVVTEHDLGQRLFPVGRARLAVGTQRLALQRVGLVFTGGSWGCHGGCDHQQRVRLGIAVNRQHRQAMAFALGELKFLRRHLVADGLQQRLHQVDQQRQPVGGLALGD